MIKYDLHIINRNWRFIADSKRIVQIMKIAMKLHKKSVSL